MLDAARRLSSAKTLEEAFRGVRRRDDIYQRQATIIGKLLCLLFFAFRFDNSPNQKGATAD
jgi:hypothetical protein